jgi:hypothetical protein
MNNNLAFVFAYTNIHTHTHSYTRIKNTDKHATTIVDRNDPRVRICSTS